MIKPQCFAILGSFLLSIILSPSISKAQDSISTLKPHQLKLNAKTLGLNLSYEAKLTTTLSCVSTAGIAFGGSSNFGRYSLSNAFKVVNPELGAEVRYYYNFKQRGEGGKKTTNNAANFIGFNLVRGFMPFTSAELTTTSEYHINGVRQPDIVVPIEPYASWSIGPNWGIQRQVGKRFSLDLLLGLSADYLSDNKQWYFAPSVNFRFGYVLF